MSALMSGSMRSAAGRTAAARSRSAGMPPAGPCRGRSSPGGWRTVTGPSASALPAKAWTSPPGTGEPASWAAPEAATISWLEHAAAYAAMKWPLAAACTRAGIADALAAITPALLTPGRGGPPAAVLRAALYGHAFNPSRADADPGLAAAGAMAWASYHCLGLRILGIEYVVARTYIAICALSPSSSTSGFDIMCCVAARPRTPASPRQRSHQPPSSWAPSPVQSSRSRFRPRRRTPSGTSPSHECRLRWRTDTRTRRRLACPFTLTRTRPFMRLPFFCPASRGECAGSCRRT